MNNDELKEVYKQALKEFLDEKYAAFGKWAMRSILAMALAALMYFILAMNGWQKTALPKL